MDAHYVNGGDRGSGVGEKGHGNSLAVRQFVELARGERRVCKPANQVHVITLAPVEFFCLHCFDVRWFDIGFDAHNRIVLSRCRTCGKGV